MTDFSPPSGGSQIVGDTSMPAREAAWNALPQG